MTSEDLGRLLQLISHEVRAPLGVMRGYLRLLEQQGTELSDVHRHAVAAAFKASEKATDLLAQVSVLARLHRGESTIHRKLIPLEPLLRAAVHAVAMPPEPLVTIHIECPQHSAVNADEEYLRLALTGLTCAVVRAQAVDGRVFLRAQQEEVEGHRALLVSITAKDDPSYRDHPLDTSRGGLGVDLPIASYLVEAHGGRVLERRDGDRFVGVVVWLAQ